MTGLHLLDLAAAGGMGLLWTALILGVRHGFDWDHIAAITDVTSTTATADVAEEVHEASHSVGVLAHAHGHGGQDEVRAHADPSEHPHAHVAAPATSHEDGHVAVAAVQPRFGHGERHALALGTLYAVGHALVVAALGALALLFGAVLPAWVDPIMGRVVGFTLLVLGAWVFISLYQYARHGHAFRLRSRWMLVFDGARHLWRRFQARLHGHEHADPIEMTAYGPRTALAVGMIHGIGAETGTQVLLIAAIGGASSQGLGLPMLAAFIVGLLLSNSIVVFITATGFIASRARERLYIAVGVLAGAFSLVIGVLFLFRLEGVLPALDTWLAGLGLR